MKNIALLMLLAGLLACSSLNLTNISKDDDYLFLEKVKGLKALSFSNKESKITLDHFKETPVYNEVYKNSLRILKDKDKIPSFSIKGKYIYSLWKDEKNPRGILRRQLKSEVIERKDNWEDIIDIDALAKKDKKSWVYKGCQFSPDFSRCLMKLSDGGKDASYLREFNLKTKSFVKNGFNLGESKKYYTWINLNSLLITTNFSDEERTKSGYASKAYIWDRGKSLFDQKPVFEISQEHVGLWPWVDQNSGAIFLTDSETFYLSNYFIYNEKKKKFKKIALPKESEIEGVYQGNLIWTLKKEQKVIFDLYPAGSLFASNLESIKNGVFSLNLLWRPDSSKPTLNKVYVQRDYLLLSGLDKVKPWLARLYFKRKKTDLQINPIELPNKNGSLYLKTYEEGNDFFFSQESFLSPDKLYYYQNINEAEKITEIKSLKEGFKASEFIEKQFFATSKDGVKVPYFIVYPKEMKFNSKNSTLVYAYGGFEVSLRPHYSKIIGENWLSKNKVYVLANIRGGGEFGPEWHQAALKEKRQTAFNDLYAVAEDLIKKKITSSEKLGVWGGSNGGLLTGVALTQRSNLFKAVISEVPLLDMKRFHLLLAGNSWMGEYGNPDTKDWDFISKYSPFHNIFQGKKYSTPLIMTSTLDDRVHPAHARKMALKMKVQKHPYYFFENVEGGHSGTVGFDQKARRYALIFSYLNEVLDAQ